MTTLVGSPNLKEAVLTQDGPAELLPASPLKGNPTKVSPLNMDDTNEETGGPWKAGSHNAWDS